MNNLSGLKSKPSLGKQLVIFPTVDIEDDIRVLDYKLKVFKPSKTILL